MIQVFEGARAPGFDPILDNMHRDRKRVFVDLLKWDVPVIDGAFEIDQFDGSEAVYLVATDEDGGHRGSIRLLPTDGPHILGSIFPWLCDGPVPSGPDIWELSRGCVSPRLRATERLRVRNQLTTAAVEFGLLRGVSAYSCIADSGWLSQVLALGWNCMPLGLPQTVGRVLTGALRIDINTATLRLLRDAGTYVPTQLVMGGLSGRIAA